MQKSNKLKLLLQKVTSLNVNKVQIIIGELNKSLQNHFNYITLQIDCVAMQTFSYLRFQWVDHQWEVDLHCGSTN